MSKAWPVPANATRLYASARLTHDVLDNGVHVFTFYESSRQALDEWFTRVEENWRAYPQHGQTIRAIVDSSACGTQPLSYALHRGRRLIAEFGYRPPSRTAFIEQNMVMVRLLDTFLHMLVKSLRVRYFTPGHRDEALAWLLAE